MTLVNSYITITIKRATILASAQNFEKLVLVLNILISVANDKEVILEKISYMKYLIQF